jgi:hypothetical protein
LSARLSAWSSSTTLYGQLDAVIRESVPAAEEARAS